MADGDVPDAGDVLWIDFGPPIGREQAGRRPAVVLTPQAYNSGSSVLIVCPISRTPRPWPYYVPLPAMDELEGFILVDQIKVIDPSLRALKAVGRIPSDTMAEVRAILASLLQIPVSN